MVSDEFREIEALLAAIPRPETFDLEQMRMSADGLGLLIPTPDGVAVETIDLGTCSADLLTPAGWAGGRTIVYLHGGGFVSGSAAAFRSLPARLAIASGSRALVVDYRLAPEQPFPAALDDVLAGHRWLAADRDAGGGVVFAGDSAGAGLAVTAALSLRDAGGSVPAAVVCFSPWFDLDCPDPDVIVDDPLVELSMLRSAAAAYAPGRTSDAMVSPAMADPTGLPPILIQVGSREVLRQSAERFAERAQRAGVVVELEVWDEMIHVWQLFAGVPEAEAALAKAATFIVNAAL